jgi:hypothetical protein
MDKKGHEARECPGLDPFFAAKLFSWSSLLQIVAAAVGFVCGCFVPVLLYGQPVILDNSLRSTARPLANAHEDLTLRYGARP